MSSRVSYGSLSGAVIGGLDVLVRGLFQAAGTQPAITLSNLGNLIQYSDSGIWGDEPLDAEIDPRVFRVSDFVGDFALDYGSAPARNIPSDKLSKFLLVNGDILVVKSSGSANHVVSGRTAVFRYDGSKRFAASNFLLRLRAKPDVDPVYLAFVLGSPPIRERVADLVKTMTYPNLPFSLYKQIQLPVVPYPDQQIVGRFCEALFGRTTLPSLPPYLDQCERKISVLERCAATIDEMAILRQQAAAESEALIVSFHNDASHGRKRKLGQILELYEESIPVLPTGSYPQVGIRSFGMGLFTKAPVAGVETTYKAFNRLYTGAVVMSQVKGWEGAVAVCPPELNGWFVSPEYRTFRCLPGESLPGYLEALVKTEWFWGRLAAATRGVGARRERTRPEQFLGIEIAMPDVDRQRQGEAIFLQVSAIQNLQDETISGLDALLPAIRSRAL